MPTDSENRLEALFHAAKELATSQQREVFLRNACKGDTALEEEVKALLEASERAENLFPNATANDLTKMGTPGNIRLTEEPGDQIGRYKLLQQIGEGGFGVVYMAEQKEPVKRRVALKIIKLGMDTKQVVARFEAERQALAMMDHPNIAKVLDGGATDSGRPYFVMELVKGAPITKFCDENNLSTQERLELFTTVCTAIQHAHQKGIIHRDVKPTNILVTLHDGKPVPQVIDFGIAKATQQELTEKTIFTQFQQMIGTPAYMSPEQAEMSGLDIDTRTDIYSLGVLLYELLTGRTPLDAKLLLSGGYDEIRRRIKEEEPLRPSTRVSTMEGEELTINAKHRNLEPHRFAAELRGDLDWIVMKALEKERSRRYETANGFAADIGRFLSNEPVVARPPSPAYRFQKFVRRNKLAFTAVAAIATALVFGVIVSIWQAVRATRAEREQIRLRQQAQANEQKALTAQRSEAQLRQKAQAQELAKRRMAYDSDMNLAQQALAAKNLGHVQRLLDRHRPKPGEEDLRNWEWRFLWQHVQSDASFVLAREPGRVFGVRFSLDGKLLASGGMGEVTVKIWDVAKRQAIKEIPNSGDICRAFGFSPRGDLFAAVYKEDQTNKFVGLWDVRTWRQVGRVTPKWPHFLTFSPDGRLLATRASESVTVWDVAAKIELVTFDTEGCNGSWGGIIAFSPDSKLVIAGGAKGKVRVFDLSASKPKFVFSDEEQGGQVLALAVSPDGKVLASARGYSPAPIKLWDLEKGTLLTNLTGHAACVFWLAFSPDGRTLASCSGEHPIRLWDVAARRQIAELRGHSDEVYGIAFSPDGKTLASGGRDGSIQFWDASPKERPRSFQVLSSDWSIFTPDGSSYAFRETNGWIGLYDNATGGQKDQFRDTNDWDFAFSPGGDLITVGSDSIAPATELEHAPVILQVHNSKTHNVVTNILPEGRGLLGWDTTGGTFATLGWQTNKPFVTFWDPTSWRKRGSIVLPASDGEGPAQTQVSFTEKMLACPCRDRLVAVLEIPSGKMLASLRAHSEPSNAVAFSPDGSLLATGCINAEAKIWDTTTWQMKHVLRGHLLTVFAVAFSPDGRRLATASTGKEAVKLWDVATGQELATLEGQNAFCWRVMFSADGRSILAGPNLWRAPTWPEIEAEERVGRERGVLW